jgi:PAS domain S-box-containing protein
MSIPEKSDQAKGLPMKFGRSKSNMFLAPSASQRRGANPVRDTELQILIVYDRVESRVSLEKSLSRTDIKRFNVRPVPASLAELCFSAKPPYDICLIDSSEATSLMSKARLLGFNIPMIVLTEDLASEVLDAIHAGASDCVIATGFTPAQLEESICSTIEKVRTREQSAEHERLYLGLVENSTDVIYAIDLKGDFDFINRAGEKVIGYSREEFITMNINQVVDYGSIDLFWRAVNEMLEDHRPRTQELTFVHKSGRRNQLSMAMHLIYRDGSPVAVQVIAREQLTSESTFSEPTHSQSL